MGQLVLGLDIGSYAIKASLFETTFQRFELVNLFESTPLYIEDANEAERKKAIQAALANLLSSNRLAPDIIVTSLPGTLISSRILHFPFGDRKKIEKALPFELEAHIPFPLDEIVIDYQTARRERSGATIIACAVQKNQLKAYLDLLLDCGIDPRIVSIDSLSLFNLMNVGNLELGGTYAFVDLGHSKTSICLVKKGWVQFVRTIFIGGQAITDGIRYDFDLVYRQAERLKHQHATLELENQPLQHKELRKIAHSVRKAVDPLVGEIIQTIHAFHAGTHHYQGEKQRVEKVMITGGTSLLPNLGAYLQQISGLPVQSFSIFSEDQDLRKKIGPREPVLHQAIALGLRSAGRGVQRELLSKVNFRQGEFAQRQELQALSRNLRKYGTWAAVLFFCFFLNFGVRYQLLHRQLARSEARIIELFRATVIDSDPKKPISAAQALKVMQGKLGENQKKYEVLTAGLREVTALEILRATSDNMPKDTPVDISELNISGGKVFLRGETDSYASVDRIVSSLGQYDKFAEVKKGEVKDSLDPNKKTFSLSITLAGGEEKR
jgi:general secretion pathway protein L